MITISACLIVKNEEQVLARCLTCLEKIADEIIIVDTGSTDKTKQIASQYTDKIYDYSWKNDFAAARNFSFEKASKDYIYVADADEVIDEENQRQFLQMKDVLDPQIEIVQMYYANQLAYNTTYNFDREYRPKLYKRERNFTWIDPIHESVRLEPIIYDSDITVIHQPVSNHAGRDFSIFQSLIKQNIPLSEKLISMYARELYIAGTKQDFIDAAPYFETAMEQKPMKEELLKQCQCIIAKAARITNNEKEFFKICLKNVAMKQASSELCYELGEFYMEQNDPKEASIWYYNAAFETEPELNLNYGGEFPRRRLSKCYEALGNRKEAEEYEKMAQECAVLKGQ